MPARGRCARHRLDVRLTLPHDVEHVHHLWCSLSTPDRVSSEQLMDIASITAALAGIKTATEIASRFVKSGSAVEVADVTLKLSELMTALAEATSRSSRPRRSRSASGRLRADKRPDRHRCTAWCPVANYSH
jgi:hypothetical protein